MAWTFPSGKKASACCTLGAAATTLKQGNWTGYKSVVGGSGRADFTRADVTRADVTSGRRQPVAAVRCVTASCVASRRATPWASATARGRKLVFEGKSKSREGPIEFITPRFAFTRTAPAVARARQPITLLFPVDPELARISQSPLDGAGFMRNPSHTLAEGNFEAIDIDAPLGTLILAPADGRAY